LDLLLAFQWRQSPTLTAHRFFPLYFYEQGLDGTSWSFLGYDQVALAGYGHHQTGTWHHFLPLYRTTDDRTTQEQQTDALGIGPLSLFRQWSSPAGAGHRFFPLYAYDRPHADEWHLSALFSGPLSLYRHDAKGTVIRDRLFPLYDWSRNGDWRELGVLGMSSWSLFYRETSPTLSAHRLFPIYRYRHQLDTDEESMETLLLHRRQVTPTRGHDRFLFLWDATWQRQAAGWELDVLGLKPFTWFHQESTPARTANRLFPLYGYEASSPDAWRLSVLGFPPQEHAWTWALYQQSSSPTYLLTRLFPFYRFEKNDATNEVHWSALLLYRHAETDAQLLDTFPPLHEYTRDNRTGRTELHLVGLKPLTLFRYGTAPDSRQSHLFPLYDFDEAGDSRRLSLLGWPKIGTLPTPSLFEMEETPSLTAHRFFPLYRYRRDDLATTRDWEALLLWWHRDNAQRLRDVFLPLVDIEHDREREIHDVGVLGIRPFTTFRYHASPAGLWHSAALLYKYSREGERQRLSALGLPHFGRGPALSLFALDQTPTVTSHRLFPIYGYTKNDEAHTLNWQALFLWWHRQTESQLRNFFVPLADIESDRTKDTRRVSLLGLPRIGPVPAITLFNWEQTPSHNSHRLFPVYQYRYDQAQDVTTWTALWLYWHHTDPAETRDTFFPLGSFWRNETQQTWSFSAVGIEPFSLARFSGHPRGIRNRFTPLWDYQQDGSDWEFSLVGIKRLAMFSHAVTGETTRDHLFPLWWHEDSPTGSTNMLVPLWSRREDRQTEERQLGVLGIGPWSLYYQQQAPSGMTARLFPAWSYQYEEATQESHTGVLGIPPLSLYYGHTTPTKTENRLFPFFGYTNDRITNESEFRFLWPLVDYKSAQGRTTEMSFLWWLFEYRSPKEDEWEYWVLGHPPVSLYMRVVSPTKTVVEVNPIIPGWRREYVDGVGTSWRLFGGLIGMDAEPDGTHTWRLFWMKMSRDKEGT
jgi:hypothetical protein